LNGHVAGKKTGRYFPYPSCPEGEIHPKEQKYRNVEIGREKTKLERITNDKKRKRDEKKNYKHMYIGRSSINYDHTNR
jgi:hypothetical protein